MKRKYLLTLALLLNMLLQAQDIHFSQFNEQPALVNPALTGATAPMRASLAYRDQWRSVTSPYRTIGASFEKRFNSDNWEQVDKFRTMTFKERSMGRLAAGLSVYKDNAGDGNMGMTEANLSIATFVPLNRKSFLSVGLQASIVQRRLDNSKLVFPDQYNGTYYDADMPSEERYQRTGYTYADFGAGALWSYGQNDKDLLGKKKLKAVLGFAVYHFNRPDKSFLISDKNASFFKYVTHGSLLMSLTNTDYAIEPSYLLQFRGSSNELMTGAMVKRYINLDSKYTGLVKRSSLGLGAYVRNRDAAILCVAMELKEQLALGVSYDLNVSRLVAGTNARGGMELTMRYTPPNAYLYQKKEEPK